MFRATLLLLAACTGGDGAKDGPEGDTATDDTATTETGDGVLPGAADDPAWAALPELDIPDLDPDALLDVGGVFVATDRISLLLEETATVGEVNALATDLDATVLGTDARVGRLVLQLPDGADVDPALATADAAAGVTTAAHGLSLSRQALPPVHDSPEGLDASEGTARWRWQAEPTGSNWGLDFVRAPAVWNLRPLLIDNADNVPALIVAEWPWTPHEDVELEADFWDRYAAATDESDAHHAMAVMGLLAARWDATGVEAVLPADGTALSAPVDAIIYDLDIGKTSDALAQSRFLDRMQSALLDGRPGSILNLSAGNNPVSCSPRDGGGYTCTYTETETLQGLMDRAGADWAAWAARVDRHLGDDRWIMVCSAGNTHVSEATAGSGTYDGLVALDYTAAQNSGCGNAAARGLNPHFVVVEALSPGGGLWDEGNPNGSATGGTIAAPGDDVGHLAGPTTLYGQGDGTSYAAPMVGSTLATLWTLDPDASMAQVRAALLAGAKDAQGGSAPRLDAWGAVEALAEARELDLPVWLADVDDRTEDGSLRRAPESGATTAALTAPRGDACVDMRDLRAFRDALWDARSEGHEALDGGYDHPLRDGNLDGINAPLSEDPQAPPEAVGSRFDLDGDGEVTLLDAEVMAAAWGTCRDGATRAADVEGWAATDLDRLSNSLDLWVEADEALRVQITGQRGETVDPDTQGSRMRGDLFLTTVPLDVCAGLEVRAGTTVWIPDDPQPAMDHVLAADALSTGFEAPLAYLRTGPSVDETPLHSIVGDTYSAGAGLDGPLLSAPQGDRVAGSASGAVEVTDTSGTRTRINLAGISDDTTALAWLPDGSGVMARATDGWGSDALGYADVAHGVGWSLAGGVDLHWLDAPALSASGDAFFVGQDRVLYRQSVRAPPPDLDTDDLLSWAAGELSPTCSDGSGESPQALVDLDATLGEAYLVRATPSAASPDGGKLLLKAANGDGTWDLLIMDTGGASIEVLVEGWQARGGEEVGWEPWPSDGVSWLPDSKGLLYLAPDGVHRITWETAGVPSGVSVSTGVVSGRVGPLAASPSGNHFVIGAYRGPASARYLDLTIVSLIDGSESGTLENRLERGLPAWSSDGTHLAYTAAASSTTSDVVVVTAAGDEVFDTRDWVAPNGYSRTIERFPSWGVDLQGW
jgi:hypothetical protein